MKINSWHPSQNNVNPILRPFNSFPKSPKFIVTQTRVARHSSRPGSRLLSAAAGLREPRRSPAWDEPAIVDGSGDLHSEWLWHPSVFHLAAADLKPLSQVRQRGTERI